MVQGWVWKPFFVFRFAHLYIEVGLGSGRTKLIKAKLTKTHLFRLSFMANLIACPAKTFLIYLFIILRLVVCINQVEKPLNKCSSLESVLCPKCKGPGSGVWSCPSTPGLEDNLLHIASPSPDEWQAKMPKLQEN